MYHEDERWWCGAIMQERQEFFFHLSQHYDIFLQFVWVHIILFSSQKNEGVTRSLLILFSIWIEKRITDYNKKKSSFIPKNSNERVSVIISVLLLILWADDGEEKGEERKKRQSETDGRPVGGQPP